jgi:predicted aspartyl protease
MVMAVSPVTAASLPQAHVLQSLTTAAIDPEAVLDTAQDRHQRMTVDVFVNGEGPFPFAVDTGAERTVISSSLAKRLGLTADKSAALHGVAGVDVVKTALVKAMRVGTRWVTNVQAPILPDASVGAAGLLGIDALADQRVIMDFAEAQLSIKPGAYREPDDADTIVVRARRRFGQLVLVDASIDGERVYAIVDSGSQTTIGNPALQRMLRRKREGSGTTELVSVTGRTIAADYGTLPQMKIGGIKIGDIPIVYSDAHPFKKFGLTRTPALLLGADVLRAFERVSLDFDTKKVRFLLKDS